MLHVIHFFAKLLTLPFVCVWGADAPSSSPPGTLIEEPKRSFSVGKLDFPGLEAKSGGRAKGK